MARREYNNWICILLVIMRYGALYMVVETSVGVRLVFYYNVSWSILMRSVGIVFAKLANLPQIQTQIGQHIYRIRLSLAEYRY